MKVETTDLYFGAYLMSKGISLDDMHIQSRRNRHKIIFIFSGNKSLNQLNHAFQKGHALVNPIDLKKSILHLKDMMYERLRRKRCHISPLDTHRLICIIVSWQDLRE